jgi:hypothetical protein
MYSGSSKGNFYRIQQEAIVGESDYTTFLRETINYGDYYTVLDTRQVRSWSRGKDVIGKTFRVQNLKDSEKGSAFDVPNRVSSHMVFVTPKNEYGMNLEATDIRFATKEEIAAYEKSTPKIDFKVGDLVVVTDRGLTSSQNKNGVVYAIHHIKQGIVRRGQTETIYNLSKKVEII